MATKASVAISAQNTFSSKFFLAGDGTSFSGRRASLCASVAAHGSTVTIRRYDMAQTNVIGVKEYDDLSIDALEVPVEGWYDIGVATGDYGSTAFTITVEQ